MTYTPNIIIHIGAPKTASSAIQSLCLNNIELLEKYGFYYPKHELDLNGVSGGHSEFSQLVIHNDIGKASKWIAKHYAKAVRKKCILLISAESLYQFSDGLKATLGDMPVKIVGYFRNPIEAIVSNHNQMIKRALLADDLMSFCEGVLMKPSASFYSGREFSKWQKNFADQELRVKPFEKRVMHAGKVEKDFLNEIGLSDITIDRFCFPDRIINASYKPSAMQLKRVLNAVLDSDQVESNAAIDQVLQQYSDTLNEVSPSTIEKLGTRLHEKLYRHFREDLCWLEEKVFCLVPDNLWEMPEYSALSPYAKCGAKYSLEFAYQTALQKHPELDSYIRECIEKMDAGEARETISEFIPELRPEGLSGLKPEVQQDVLIKASKKLTKSTHDKADYLRELALIYESIGQEEIAFKLIDLAIKDRPTGPVIRKIYNRLK